MSCFADFEFWVTQADFLIAKAQSEDNPYKIRRSTTGHKSWTQLDEDEDTTVKIPTMLQ